MVTFVVSVGLQPRRASHRSGHPSYRKAPDMSAPASACASAMPDQRLDALVVQDDIVADDPVMAVGVIGIERHIRHYRDLDPGIPDRTGGSVRQVVRVPRLFAKSSGLQRGIRYRGRCRSRGCPRVAASRAASTSRSTLKDVRHPGIDATGIAFDPVPSRHENRPDQIVQPTGHSRCTIARSCRPCDRKRRNRVAGKGA